MSLDVYLTAVRRTTVYDANITHNLGVMADAAGIYQALWRPDEIGITHAAELIIPLRPVFSCSSLTGRDLKRSMRRMWGLYEYFVPFVEQYLAACEENPDAEISVSR